MGVESAAAWVRSSTRPQLVYQACPVRRREGWQDPQGCGNVGIGLPQGEQAQNPLRNRTQRPVPAWSATAHGG
jgi:hypothetical protein